MKRVGRALVAAVMTSVIFATTVFATPEDELRQEKAEKEAKIEALENQMIDIMEKINETEMQLVESGQKIIEATEDLYQAEEKEKTQYEAMKHRIVALYENGNSSMIEMILEAGSIAEMLKQAENVQTIHTYDRKQLEEYVKTKDTIATLKVMLEEEQIAIEERQADYQKDKEELDGMIAALENEVDDLEVRIQAAAATASRPQTGGSGNGSNSNYVPPVGTGGGAAIVSAAYKYLGVPYVWGGASASGVDCSGLVLLAHKAIGVNLAHFSGSQGSGGKAVSKANAQPGDVVCYAGHVGIYLGGGKMIHAPQTGDVVKVVNVYGNPWYRRYW